MFSQFPVGKLRSATPRKVSIVLCNICTTIGTISATLSLFHTAVHRFQSTHLTTQILGLGRKMSFWFKVNEGGYNKKVLVCSFEKINSQWWEVIPE